MFAHIVKILFFGLIIKPVVLIALGLNVVNRNKLPTHGPAILAPNHNSHLDTMVLMSLFPLRMIHKVRPVAAADYFLANRIIAWFALHVIGIIPLNRKQVTRKAQLFEQCHEALKKHEILIFFPEGSRGEPEKMAQLKKGIFHLISNSKSVLVYPVMMHGLGRSLPKGEALFVPFNCDVIVGEPLSCTSHASELVQEIERQFKLMRPLCLTYRADEE
ncbi:1-acyl-sn-glycerol-3-phosphate acyltransferase [Pseudoalteromonas piscicida]|uniref:lysophospholipid acyltransferase family protein n=1 Tax=Pseudoalteromonas piscicida TaxID=43662 RepID=UPI001EFD5BF8|nr:lysophospholipid acyltransferase family protein [Pseudoalteromonas piscicida]MCG9770735.1 1-acyl-sn-glycerol-3-phosphate acyltransferase [Pseudoalteromonas piscicida]